MKTFLIDPRENSNRGVAFDSFYVEAENHDLAASIAAKKMLGGTVFGKRQSGEPGGSGCYQAYYQIGNQCNYNCAGSLFHVMEI